MSQVIPIRPVLEIPCLGRVSACNIKVIEDWGDHILCAKEIDGKLYALSRFLFTTGFLLELGKDDYKGRYCFSEPEQALAFFVAYNGTQEAVVGEKGCTAIK